MLDLLKSIIQLGLPVAGMSWFIFSKIYGSGDVDRGADRKQIKSAVKSLKASFKAQEKRNVNFVYDKWMWFGSGFYGLAALWTFAVIEIVDVLNFVFNFPGLAVLFADGLFGLAVDLFGNQIGNLVSAFVWFGYWDADSIWIWILIAYLGYWAGVELARREVSLPADAWLEKLRLKLKR